MCFLNTQILRSLFGWYISLFAFLCSARSATKQVKKGITSFYSGPRTEQPCKKLVFFTQENKPSPNVLRILLFWKTLLSAIFSDIQNLNIKAPSHRGPCDGIKDDLESKAAWFSQVKQAAVFWSPLKVWGEILVQVDRNVAEKIQQWKITVSQIFFFLGAILGIPTERMVWCMGNTYLPAT